MGMLDNNTKLATAQAVTATGDTASTNTYDCGTTDAAMALTGENLWINAVVHTTPTSGGAATIQAVLQDSADNSSFADVLAGPAIAYGSAPAGTVLLQTQPPTGMRRYFRIAWRIGTAVLTAGAFDAYVSNTIQRNLAKPSGFTVS